MKQLPWLICVILLIVSIFGCTSVFTDPKPERINNYAWGGSIAVWSLTYSYVFFRFRPVKRATLMTLQHLMLFLLIIGSASTTNLYLQDRLATCHIGHILCFGALGTGFNCIGHNILHFPEQIIGLKDRYWIVTAFASISYPIMYLLIVKPQCVYALLAVPLLGIIVERMISEVTNDQKERL